MTCPKCGLQTLADQKFCRSCGTRLPSTTRQLVQPDAVDRGRTSTVASKAGKARGINFELWGFIILFIGAAVGVVGKKLLYQDVITAIGVLTALVGMFLSVYPYLLRSRRKDDSSSFSQPEVLSPSQLRESLPQASSIEFVPSVTERTTNLLKNSAGKTKAQKEDRDSET